MNILNKVQSLMIEFANKNGTNLATEFGTIENFKRFVIGFTLKTLVDAGVETSKAYDMVFGQGSYEKLANDVWAAANN